MTSAQYKILSQTKDKKQVELKLELELSVLDLPTS